jgi:hypothetical protein
MPCVSIFQTIYCNKKSKIKVRVIYQWNICLLTTENIEEEYFVILDFKFK